MGLTVGESCCNVKLTYAATFLETVLFGDLVCTRIGRKLERVVFPKWVIIWTQTAVWCAHLENNQMGLQDCAERAVLLLLVRISPPTRDPCCHVPYWDVTRVITVQILPHFFPHIHLQKSYRYTLTGSLAWEAHEGRKEYKYTFYEDVD